MFRRENNLPLSLPDGIPWLLRKMKEGICQKRVPNVHVEYTYICSYPLSPTNVPLDSHEGLQPFNSRDSDKLLGKSDYVS